MVRQTVSLGKESLADKKKSKENKATTKISHFHSGIIIRWITTKGESRIRQTVIQLEPRVGRDWWKSQFGEAFAELINASTNCFNS